MAKLLTRHFVEKNVLEMAYERLNHIFDLFDHVCVSFSGGKDSTVCLNLALEIARKRKRLPLRVFFFDEEAIPYQTEEFCRRISKNPDIEFEWYCLPLKMRNACSYKHPEWYCWAPECEDLWVRPLPPEAIQELDGFSIYPKEDRMSIPEMNNLLCPAEKYGTTGMVLGIRTQESLTRHRAVVRRESDNYIIGVSKGSSWGSAKFAQGNTYKVYPIYDWKTEDVWTAPKMLGWDYNRAYDVMDKAGITPHSQRVCPAFGEEPIRSLWIYSVCFPEIWDAMTRRVPGVNAAYRYSRTELYSYGSKPKKPEGMTWEEFIAHHLKKFNVSDQVKVAMRIQKEIRQHFKHTSDPILPHAVHPRTGLSWDFMVAIAMRGDFKERKQACFNLNLSDPEGHKRKYGEEYEKETGRKWMGMKLKG